MKIQTNPVHKYSEVILIDERKWNDTLACQHSKGHTFEAEVSKLVMRLVRHFDQAERETVGAVHRKSMGPKLRKALRKVGGQKFSGSDCLHHIYKSTKLGSSVARIQRRLVVHSCFSRTHWWDGDRASVDGSCHHSMEMERISVSSRMLL